MAVCSLQNKQCASDLTWLLKECSAKLIPFLCRLLNTSLLSGIVLAAIKSVYICPLLKRPDLDTTDVKNYRLISNLTMVLKLLERLVARQLLG